MPWFSKEINLTSNQSIVCCWMKSQADIEKVKSELLKDRRPSECEKCWNCEDNNIESRRQMENRFLDYALDIDLDLIKKQVIETSVEPVLYQFTLGSLCNSTCVTCGPGASSAWESLIGERRSIKIENKNVNDNFKKQTTKINWKKVKRINLLGGEPLLIKESTDILNCLLDAGNTNCLISFVTNGSVKLTKKQIELFKKFSKISVCVSIDGTDKLFEYLRYPLSWNQIVANIDIYQSVFYEITASFTISNLNYHARNHMINWFNQQNILYIENYVIDPDYFHHNVIPGSKLWPKFVEEINKQDGLKGISIKDYIPSIYKLITEFNE